MHTQPKCMKWNPNRVAHYNKDYVATSPDYLNHVIPGQTFYVWLCLCVCVCLCLIMFVCVCVCIVLVCVRARECDCNLCARLPLNISESILISVIG